MNPASPTRTPRATKNDIRGLIEQALDEAGTGDRVSLPRPPDAADGALRERNRPGPLDDASYTKRAAAIALCRGFSLDAIETHFSVSRRSIQRWKKSDPQFQAAMREFRRTRRDLVRERLHETAAEAAQVVAQAIRDGDSQIALRLLERLDLLRPWPADGRGEPAGP